MNRQTVDQAKYRLGRGNPKTTVVKGRRPFGKYQRALHYLLEKANYESKLPAHYDARTCGLARIRALLSRVGNPQKKLRTVHITGTKGKGSTATMLARMLEADSYSVGLYTSPHVEDLRERLSVNNKMIGKRQLVDLLNRIYPPLQKLARADELTFFDIMTTLAFLHFADSQVDLAVIETGFGGGLDSTNVLTPEVVGITSLSLDHQHLLGPTIELIAAEKAGVFKPGVPVVTVNQNPKAMDVLQSRAVALDAPLSVVGRDIHYSYRYETSRDEGPHGRICLTTETSEFQHLRVPLHGEHQAKNCALALAILDKLKERGFAIDDEKASQGLSSVELPGRMEMIGNKPRVLIDGAHNAASIRALIRAVALYIPADSVVMVFGCNRDKDIEGMLNELQYGADKVIFTGSDNPWSECPYDLMKRYSEKCGKMCQVAGNLEQALMMAQSGIGQEDLICITGSFYLIGAARTRFDRHQTLP
jgi:dihydrofolate synthase / folylpolyglutamate synthase